MISISELQTQLDEHREVFNVLDRKLKVLRNEIQDDKLEGEVVADILSGHEDEDLIEDDREGYLDIILRLEDVINSLSKGRRLDNTQRSFLKSIGMIEP